MPLPKNVQNHRHQGVIAPECAGQRLDQALAKLFPDYSRSRLQRWLADGRILIDGTTAVAKRTVIGGECVQLDAPPDASETADAPEAIALAIVYEDDALIVIDKPAGLVVHPGSGNWSGTLLNALLAHAPQLAAIPRAGIVHRLDKDTSGLLVVAKTLAAQTALVRQLQARSVKREYAALVYGVVARDGEVEAPIGRDPRVRTRMAVVAGGRPARTHYRVLERFACCTLLTCQLETGRTHQIRVHLASIGHPLVGDPVYRKRVQAFAAPALAAFARQALHAQRLALVHPVTQREIQLESPLPEDFGRLLQGLRSAG
jgi:23S rRNA pseudouridine1911/1915/1917 synthase